jgi:flavodoxin I
MAEAIAKGASNKPDITVELSYHIDAQELTNYDAVFFGAPTYRAEMPIDFKNLFLEVKEKKINLQNKIGAAFGSYGWSGEAPQAVTDILKSLGMQVKEPPIKAKLKPEQNTLEECESLGRAVADELAKTK